MQLDDVEALYEDIREYAVSSTFLIVHLLVCSILPGSLVYCPCFRFAHACIAVSLLPFLVDPVLLFADLNQVAHVHIYIHTTSLN